MAKRQIEEFELGDVIGVGTVGTIYRARDRAQQQDVAVKILLHSVSREPLIQARFGREMLILEKLSHPGIVRYFGGGNTGEQLFFAMELLEGGSLRDELERGGRLACVETLTCGVELCSALQHAHNHGVIHRDLKPSNLLFDEGGRIKLVDFGIARDTYAADITSEGLTVGTYAYMAPELIQGQRTITGQVDLYALGCLLFEMLTGRAPFVGANFADLFHQHLHVAPPSVRVLRPDVPVQLDELIQQLMSKRPDQRPVNARNVQGRLLQMLDRQLPRGDRSDVPAAQVLDEGRRLMAQRLRRDERQVSWIAVAGLFALAAAMVLVALTLGT